MKRILSVILMVVLCAALLTSCGKNKTKGQVVIGSSTQANGDWSHAAFGSNNATDNDVLTLTDGYNVVDSDEHGDFVINKTIVKSYERTEDADGNVTYTYEINKGLKFNNGDKITAENFLAWTLFAISPAGKELGTTASGHSIPGGIEYQKGEVNYVAGLRLLGDYKFSLTTLAVGTDGNVNLPYYFELASFGARPVSLDYWFGPGWSVKDDGQGAYLSNKDGKAFTADEIRDTFNAACYATKDRVTAGAYNLESFDPSTGEIVLVANENYAGDFQGHKPSINKIVIVKADDTTIIDTLATGGVDIFSGMADGDQVNAVFDLIDKGTIDSSTCQYNRAGFGYFGFACDLGPTQYLEFRQAVACLLDRNDFANTFCQGWGGVVHGPYCTAFSMYEDSKEFLAENLDPYDFDPARAKKLLAEAGFVLNADGTDYVDGSGLVRYKKVSAEEAANYDNFCVTLPDGTILMGAIVNWLSSSGNSVSDLLSTKLANGAATKDAGIEIKQTSVDFPVLINYLYRQDASGIGGDYTIPTYNMFNLATGWSSGAYDMSYEYTRDPEYIEWGYNINHIFDEQLDTLSMDMVYGVKPGDYATYLDKWQKFVVRANYMLPQVPLYANIYVSVYPNTIANYKEDSFWGFSRAILYADYIGA